MVQLAQAAPAAAKSPVAPAVPKAEKPKKAKKDKSKLGRFNSRAIYLKGLALKLADQLVAQVDRLDEGKVRDLVAGAASEAQTVGARIDVIQKALFKLGELKWEPSSGGARLYRAGDVVSIKAKRTERFTKHGAYALADLKNCKVVSVHGAKDAKLVTPKNESLGLVPLSWLVAGDR